MFSGLLKAQSTDRTELKNNPSPIAGDSAISALYQAYYTPQRDKYGNSIAIYIDMRAALVRGDGPNVSSDLPTEESARVVAFANEMISYNGLNAATLDQILVLMEIEGRCAVTLRWDNEHIWSWVDSEGKINNEKGMVQINPLSWVKKKYVVVPNQTTENRHSQLWVEEEQVKWQVGKERPARNVTKREGIVYKFEEFAYVRYGPADNINNAISKWPSLWFSVVEIEAQMVSGHNVSHLHSVPFLVIECKDSESAAEIIRHYKDNPPLPGDILVSTGSTKYIQPALNEQHKATIDYCLDQIARCSGIPHAFLDPSRLGSKNVAQEGSGVSDSIEGSRKIIEQLLGEIITKGVNMASVNGSKMESAGISVALTNNKQKDIESLRDIYLPANIEGKLSNTTLHEIMPGVDVAKEKKRLAEEAETLDPAMSPEILDKDRSGREPAEMMEVIDDETEEEF